MTAIPRLPLIFLVRHGETDWNAAHRYQGQTDIPLNEKGRAQAVRNGRALADLLSKQGFAPAALGYVASTLARATETMAILRRELGLPADEFHRDTRLMEANYGIWEGLTVPEIRARDPNGLDTRKRDPLAFVPEGGESYDAVAERAFAALCELAGPSVVVCHGGVSKVVRGRLLGLSPRETINLPVPQDRVMRIEGSNVELL